MSKLLKYSVLRYFPSIVAGESINLGILYSEEKTGYCSFRFTQNISRIKSFDDELDRDALLDLLKGIEEDVKSDSGKGKFNIDRFIKFYINNFRFDQPQTIVYEKLDTIVERLYKSYFRFDLPKDKRPSKKEDQRIIAQLIASAGKRTYRNKRVAGSFKENILYDIVSEACYIKIFDFDGKNLKHCINSAKTWAWNCSHELEKPIYIIYRYSKTEIPSDAFRIIKQIFDEADCKFYSFDEGLRQLQKDVC